MNLYGKSAIATDSASGRWMRWCVCRSGLRLGGVTVNAVGPGFTETPATAESPETYRSSFLAQVPAARFGQPADIANAVLFLVSPAAGYVNGQAIYVDGGYSAGKLTVRD